MTLSESYKIFLIIVIILGGFWFLLGAGSAQAAVTCNCVSGQSYTASDDAISQYGNEDAACVYYCAADGGVDSVSSAPSSDNNFDLYVCGYCGGIMTKVSLSEECPADCTDEPSGGGTAGDVQLSDPDLVDQYQSCLLGCTSDPDASSSDDIDVCETNCLRDYQAGTDSGATNNYLPGTNSGLNNNLPGTNSGLKRLFTGQSSASLPNFLGVTSIKDLFLKIVTFLIDLAKYFIVLMLVWAGFLFVTAQGNETKLQTARRNLLWTVAGAAVIFASGAIMDYIAQIMGGEGSTTFMDRLKSFLNEIIALLFILVTVYFFWGVTQFVRASATGGKEMEDGKKHMLWGIIGMAVMLGAWAIAQVIQSVFK